MAVLRNPFILRLHPIDRAKIKKMAEFEDRSTNNMIEHLIVQEVRRYEAEYGEIPLSDEEVYAES